MNKGHNGRRIIAIIGAVVMLAIVSLSTASAQPFVWNPPCTLTKIVNTLGCTIDLRLVTNFGTLGPFTVAPNSSKVVQLPINTTISGVKTQAGNFVAAVTPGPVIPSPPASPGTIATSWCQAATIGAGGCCGDIYFDASGAPGCWIWIVPATAPCTP
jgi:hypothetical protein